MTTFYFCVCTINMFTKYVKLSNNVTIFIYASAIKLIEYFLFLLLKLDVC